MSAIAGMRARDANGNVIFTTEQGWWGLIVVEHTVAPQTTMSQNLPNIKGSIPISIPEGTNVEAFVKSNPQHTDPYTVIPLSAYVSGGRLHWEWRLNETGSGRYIRCLGGTIFVTVV